MNFNCKDPLVNLIKKHGFNLVLTPKENIAPFQVFSRNESGIWAWVKDVFVTPVVDDTSASLNELFLSDGALPTVKEGAISNDIKGTKSSDLEADAGVELLLNFLKLPLSEQTDELKLKVQATLKSLKKVSFSIGGDAKLRSASHVGLDSYLSSAEIKKTVGNTFKDMIDNNQLFIVTDVLLSNSFSMNGSDDDSGNVTIDLPELKDILKGKIKGSFKDLDESGVSYEGENPMVVAFKAVRLLSKKDDKGKYTFKIKKSDAIAVRGEEDFPVELLETTDNFIAL